MSGGGYYIGGSSSQVLSGIICWYAEVLPTGVESFERVTPDIVPMFGLVEEVLREEFLPALFHDMEK